MRERYQKGSVKKVGPSWVGQWWENGHRRNRTLGRVSEMSKSEAQTELANRLSPINNHSGQSSDDWEFQAFVEQIYLPFYQRKWKSSTKGTNECRLRCHLTCKFSRRRLDSFTLNELQDLLDQKTEAGLSFSIVDHLRWDLKQIFDMAIAEGYLQKNPAQLLFTPKEAPHPNRQTMNWKEVKLLFSVLDLREHLICILATITGLRPGEIFALQWRHVLDDYLDIQQRIYRGALDTPKTRFSIRKVALSGDLTAELEQWRSVSIDTNPDAWVFPSEALKTPVTKDNCWRRHIQPRLEKVGLGWVNFQVMRRTHASLMRELDVDPKVVADQLGHTLDVNLNVYTESNLGLRKKAVETLESALNGVEMEYVQ